MKLLLDECVTRRLKVDFIGHETSTVEDAGFKGFTNGDLLHAASKVFDVLITVDRKLVQQHHKSSFGISVFVLNARSNRYEDLAPLVPLVLKHLESVKPGEVVELSR